MYYFRLTAQIICHNSLSVNWTAEDFQILLYLFILLIESYHSISNILMISTLYTVKVHRAKFYISAHLVSGTILSNCHWKIYSCNMTAAALQKISRLSLTIFQTESQPHWSSHWRFSTLFWVLIKNKHMWGQAHWGKKILFSFLTFVSKQWPAARQLS